MQSKKKKYLKIPQQISRTALARLSYKERLAFADAELATVYDRRKLPLAAVAKIQSLLDDHYGAAKRAAIGERQAGKTAVAALKSEAAP